MARGRHEAMEKSGVAGSGKDKMWSVFLTKFFLVQYVVVTVVCIFEKNYITALYWFGATILTTAVLLGMMTTNGG